MELKERLKYPIKYAVMPIEEQTGWTPGLNELEREYCVVANIASKCYVIGERKEFLSDGTSRVKYEVVFPFIKKDIIHGDSFEPAVPEYDFYSQCTNSIHVDRLFSDFSEAQLEADKANEEVRCHMIGTLSYHKDFQKNLKELKRKHQETLDKYREIERIIEQGTDDMKVTKSYSFSLEPLIERTVESPSEFYTRLAKALSAEEREYLKRLIKNRRCSNCTNSSCRVEQCEKVGLDEFGESQGSNCLSWNNPELIGRQLILRKSDNTISKN